MYVQIDEHYVGMPREVTFVNVNNNVNVTFLTDMCKQFGHIGHAKVYYHPKTKRHLGIAKVYSQSLLCRLSVRIKLF